MERDDLLKRRITMITNFNSHAHVERDQTCRRSSMDIGNFNSHAHVERDKFAELTASTTGISTHTLTWSVTGDLMAVSEAQRNFNSHAHVERD